MLIFNKLSNLLKVQTFICLLCSVFFSCEKKDLGSNSSVIYIGFYVGNSVPLGFPYGQIQGNPIGKPNPNKFELKISRLTNETRQFEFFKDELTSTSPRFADETILVTFDNENSFHIVEDVYKGTGSILNESIIFRLDSLVVNTFLRSGNYSLTKK